MNRKIYVTKRMTFEAAHYLPNYDGKCNKLHGHSYKVEATFSGLIDLNYCEIDESSQTEKDLNPYNAMVCDFSQLKKAMKEVFDKYDHSNLNDFFYIPTAEYMCITMFRELKDLLSNTSLFSGVTLEVLKLWETEDSYAEYRGESTE